MAPKSYETVSEASMNYLGIGGPHGYNRRQFLGVGIKAVRITWVLVALMAIIEDSFWE